MKIDHVGIAVPELEAAIQQYSSSLLTTVGLREEVSSHGVRVAFLRGSGTDIELLAPMRDDTTIAKFLASRGPGLHHVCYEVSDIVAELKRWQALGHDLIDKTPRPGARETLVAFIHPRSNSGVLTELCQYVKARH